jgi:hypothetical protein
VERGIGHSLMMSNTTDRKHIIPPIHCFGDFFISTLTFYKQTLSQRKWISYLFQPRESLFRGPITLEGSKFGRIRQTRHHAKTGREGGI